MTQDEARTSRKNRWLLIGGALAALVVVAGAWSLATVFQSPAQQEANAKAPTASPVFASVSEGKLARQLAFTGTIGPSSRTSVTLVVASGAPLSVVTGRPLVEGGTLESGAILTEVNGRPIFVIKSPFAFYRDMGYGDSGPDVLSLQSGLAALGYSVDADGQFGARTAQAVNRWYRDNGYGAPTRERSTGASDSSKSEAGSGAVGGASAGQEAPPAPPQKDAYVPISEILGLVSSPMRVIQGIGVGGRVGVSGSADLVLGSTDTIITVSVPAAELGGVAKGDDASISLDGKNVEGTIGSISQVDSVPSDGAPSGGQSTAGSQGATANQGPVDNASSKVTFIVTPNSSMQAAATNMQATVTVTKDVVSENSLLVPTLAIVDRGSGDRIVIVRRRGGSLIEVPVTVRGTWQGQVAIEPKRSNALSVGDEVRVG